MKSSGEVKLFLGILIASLILVGIAVVPMLAGRGHGHPHQPPPPTVQPELTRAMLVPPGSQVKGNPQAKHTLVEFGDYECPTCARFHGEMKAILKPYQDRLQLVYHHFQAAQSHQHSTSLALGAYAAGLQGRFWEMHDRLYQHTDEYKNMTEPQVLDLIIKQASEMKLDVLKFRSDVTKEAAGKALNLQKEIALKAGVMGTPQFFFITPAGKVTSLAHKDLKDFLAKESNWQ